MTGRLPRWRAYLVPSSLYSVPSFPYEHDSGQTNCTEGAHLWCHFVCLCIPAARTHTHIRTRTRRQARRHAYKHTNISLILIDTYGRCRCPVRCQSKGRCSCLLWPPLSYSTTAIIHTPTDTHTHTPSRCQASTTAILTTLIHSSSDCTTHALQTYSHPSILILTISSFFSPHLPDDS